MKIPEKQFAANKENYMNQSNDHTLKLCVDCIFFRESLVVHTPAKCNHPKAAHNRDVVYGTVLYLSCQEMRQNDCGLEAKFHQIS